ncbi:tumor suppressor ARF-like isoform X2 [Dipodomys merriami]|uniref:tumor suppressor ARF-like isoform X2 n=1 Tax=Dipodomys merriami TaxID=94247 RepID=UPI00384E47CA
MVRRFLVTVRIWRAGGPPRVRTFVVQVPRAAGEGAAPRARAVVALLLMLARSQRRRRQPHPRRPAFHTVMITRLMS